MWWRITISPGGTRMPLPNSASKHSGKENNVRCTGILLFRYGTILIGISTRRELALLFETWLGDEPFLFARSIAVERSSQNADAGNIPFPCVRNAHVRTFKKEITAMKCWTHRTLKNLRLYELMEHDSNAIYPEASDLLETSADINLNKIN